MMKFFATFVFGLVFQLILAGQSNAYQVQLQWDADTTGQATGYKIYYSDASASLSAAQPIDVGAQTTATIQGFDPAKAYQFAVTAYASTGEESSFSNIVALQELVAPSVSILSPANAATVSGIVSVNVSASDNTGVTRAELYINSALVTTNTTSSLSYSWDTSKLAAGSYTLMAKAYDAAGNVGQTSSTVTVFSDTAAPVVIMTAPANNSTVNGSVTISSSASDNVGVSSVQFNCNGVALYTSNVAPYSFSWDTTKAANGSYSISAVAKDTSGNTAQSGSVVVTVNNPVTDTTAPVLISFTLPTSASSLTVPVSGLSATDNIGVTGYIVSESATSPIAIDNRWTSTVPASITFSSVGTKTVYAWAKDAAGNVSAPLSASLIVSDGTATATSTAPSKVVTFRTLAPSTTTSVAKTTASIAQTKTTSPAATLSSTTASTPAQVLNTQTPTAAPSSSQTSNTSKTVQYPGTISTEGMTSSATPATASEDTTSPVVVVFSMPAVARSKTVTVESFGATDNIGVTGYLITESATLPTAADARWSELPPASFTFNGDGLKTAYAWVKDAAGNISCATSATVTIDLTPPKVVAFTLPTSATSLTVGINSFSASDNTAVAGYLLTDKSAKPTAGDSRWSPAPPTSFTFSSKGNRKVYAWVIDTAGNISKAQSATVTIN